MTEGGRRVMEVDDFDAIKGCPWPDFWRDEGNRAAVAAIDAAREGRNSRFTGYADTVKGTRRFWDVKVSPIFAEDGIGLVLRQTMSLRIQKLRSCSVAPTRKML